MRAWWARHKAKRWEAAYRDWLHSVLVRHGQEMAWGEAKERAQSGPPMEYIDVSGVDGG